MSCPALSSQSAAVPYLCNLGRRSTQRRRGPGYTRKGSLGGAGVGQQIAPVAAQAGPQHWHFAWFAWFAWPLLIARAWPGLGAPFRARPEGVPRPLVGCSERGGGPFTFTDVPSLATRLGLRSSLPAESRGREGDTRPSNSQPFSRFMLRFAPTHPAFRFCLESAAAPSPHYLKPHSSGLCLSNSLPSPDSFFGNIITRSSPPTSSS